ncbi:hypothetical protein ENKNEFLB_03596 [Nocardioides aquaticus]|uniref:Uncharacterized protein n=1 Tax=Nocardioides aquaticus TaxID=160826 RepID=A0ABX8EPJ6_9ACTN|nr:hypothetical protein [Nocardioides aquaticus]QVT81188.1 hypothetical protein ENKNEFLB_03596 [Nocardioides aquaticus]
MLAVGAAVLLLTVIVLAVGITAAVVGGDSSDSTDEAAPEGGVASGSVTILGGGYTTNDPCYGTSYSSDVISYDNSNFTGGTPVRVLDADGTVLGSSILLPGDYDSQIAYGDGGCRLDFVVPLDDTSERYQLVIGTAPEFDFTDLDQLDLRVGGGS